MEAEGKDSLLKQVHNALCSLDTKLKNLSRFVDSLDSIPSEIENLKKEKEDEEVLTFVNLWHNLPCRLEEMGKYLVEQIQRLEQIIK